jgi:hypothetical protein
MNLASRLEYLDKWKNQYPQSDYADIRLKLFLLTYQQVNNHRAAFDTAIQILESQPKDLASLQEIVSHGLQLLPAQPNGSLSEKNKSDLDTIRKTGRYILEDLDTIYGADNKPGLMNNEDWRSAKATMRQSAQAVMNWGASVETKN